ncbi:MAG TPA: ABATE domain-containing protein [Nitrospira sp.]|nr:ABATE domain-containing protein [Nitrospira sp.]
MGKERSEQPFLFVGNHLCLDFINTQMIVRGNLTDLLRKFGDLMTWLVQATVVDADQGKVAITRWSAAEQKHVFDAAIALRKALRNMAEDIAARKAIPNSTLTAINQVLSQCPGYRQLAYVNRRVESRFHSDAGESSRLLTPLAEAASDLLCSGNLSLVKKCRNSACILYFYDTTKNHGRNWCSMQLCGNRMKVAAHYRKKRKNEKKQRR